MEERLAIRALCRACQPLRASARISSNLTGPRQLLRAAAGGWRRARHFSTSITLFTIIRPTLRRALYLSLDRLTVPWTETILCVAESLARDLIERGRVRPRR